MENCYRIVDAVIKIEHENDDLFRYIDNEIRYYRTEEKENVCGKMTIRRDFNDNILPKGAVRISCYDDNSYFAHENKTYTLNKKGFIFTMDYKGKEIILDYSEDCDQLRKSLKAFTKWLFIKASEDQGLVHIHGAAVHYNGKNIIFTGDSTCGKSSSLLRVVQNGGKVISDDAVIFDGNRLVPFTFNTTVNEDLSKRFGLDPDSFHISKYISDSKELKNADTIIFLKIYNSASILKNAKCFEFYAGSDEEEVRRTLIRFLDKN
ncbi:MAG: hypothetical protein NTY68_00165 [Candidatus Micrarchaeota archaeon]|nr:hypothetical protein [Candidatus Micrarchaeota archaeon]